MGRDAEHELISSYLDLRISALKEYGILDNAVGEGSVISWSRGDRTTGKIAVGPKDDNTLILAYSLGDDLRRDEIQLTYTPCHLGGKRTWFRCPNCPTRRGVLYGGDRRGFICRQCRDLRYESQREGKKLESTRRRMRTLLDVNGIGNRSVG